jgi:D-alanine transaminase
MTVVYLNGEYGPKSEARVSVEDRGFLFGDAVYEATPVYRGRPFLLRRHLRRMARGLDTLRIDYDAHALEPIHTELLDRNGLLDAPLAFVYCQVTRGVAPRGHAFPNPGTTPTVYAFASTFARPSRDVWEKGHRAITIPDQRWSRVDVKVTSLVANVLAQQAAVDADATNAIQVRDGMALEGSHNNFFAVIDGILTTAPANNYILHGITREYVLEIAADLGIPVDLRPIPVTELKRAEEVFFCGTTTEISPTVEIDGSPVGDGRAGPIATRLFDEFIDRTQSNLSED